MQNIINALCWVKFTKIPLDMQGSGNDPFCQVKICNYLPSFPTYLFVLFQIFILESLISCNPLLYFFS